MRSKMYVFLAAVVAALALTTFPSVASAQLVFRVNVDTTAFGPGNRQLEFVITDGSDGTQPADIGNNTATITNFQFGGGGSAGTPVVFDPPTSASGTVISGLVMSESNPSIASTLVTVPVTLGSSLQFDVSLTTALNLTGVNDSFQFRILGTGDVAVPTTDPSTLDTAVFVDINPSADLGTIESYDFTAPAGAVTITVVPEPTTAGLLAGGAMLLARRRRRG